MKGQQDNIMSRFEKYLEQKPHSESIPDYLLCRITSDFMEDPVIIQSGFTYERKAIAQHFSKNGAFDPVTR